MTAGETQQENTLSFRIYTMSLKSIVSTPADNDSQIPALIWGSEPPRCQQIRYHFPAEADNEQYVTANVPLMILLPHYFNCTFMRIL